MCPISFTSW